jgi:hypothetical protein
MSHHPAVSPLTRKPATIVNDPLGEDAKRADHSLTVDQQHCLRV